jgi:hypothetical protein
MEFSGKLLKQGRFHMKSETISNRVPGKIPNKSLVPEPEREKQLKLTANIEII